MLVTGKLGKENHRNGKERYNGVYIGTSWLFVPEIPTTANERLCSLPLVLSRSPPPPPRPPTPVNRGINRYKIAETFLKTFGHRWPFSCRFATELLFRIFNVNWNERERTTISSRSSSLSFFSPLVVSGFR